MGKLRSLVRVNEWLFSKIPSLFVPLLLFYYYEGASGDCTKVLFLYFIYLMFSFSFGYAVNDYSDREEDAIVGKRNIMGELSETQCSLILLILLCGCIPFGIICNNPVIIPIYIFVYFWGAAYSIRPFRFKERGALGLFECAIAQRMFPMFPILAYSLKTMRYVILWGSITFFAGPDLRFLSGGDSLTDCHSNSRLSFECSHQIRLIISCDHGTDIFHSAIYISLTLVAQLYSSSL